MENGVKLRNLFTVSVSYLYSLLFVYAAASKLLDYQNFRIQLAQSPLLGAFADLMSITVPVSELIIAGLLLYESSRHFGLYAGYTLMVMFSAYIYITLNYSAFIPCSCGGILEKMGWEEHLLFNLAFVMVGFLAILLSPIKIRNHVN